MVDLIFDSRVEMDDHNKRRHRMSCVMIRALRQYGQNNIERRLSHLRQQAVICCHRLKNSPTRSLTKSLVCIENGGIIIAMQYVSNIPLSSRGVNSLPGTKAYVYKLIALS